MVHTSFLTLLWDHLRGAVMTGQNAVTCRTYLFNIIHLEDPRNVKTLKILSLGKVQVMVSPTWQILIVLMTWVRLCVIILQLFLPSVRTLENRLTMFLSLC